MQRTGLAIFVAAVVSACDHDAQSMKIVTTTIAGHEATMSVPTDLICRSGQDEYVCYRKEEMAVTLLLDSEMGIDIWADGYNDQVEWDRSLKLVPSHLRLQTGYPAKVFLLQRGSAIEDYALVIDIDEYNTLVLKGNIGIGLTKPEFEQIIKSLRIEQTGPSAPQPRPKLSGGLFYIGLYKKHLGAVC